MLMKTLLSVFIVGSSLCAAQYTTTYDPSNLPDKSEQAQVGTNKCGTANNQTSLCQNVYINSLDDFCVWGAQDPGSSIGAVEQIVVAYCTKPGRGTRLFPEGSLINAHFLITPDYVQITGRGDFTKINIQAGDAGGELDPHGPDGLGNPHGGLVFSNAFGGTGLGIQIHEWTNFQSVDEFCIRACKPGPKAEALCQHIYDVMGCGWNMPGDYGDGFTSCNGDDAIPMGLYPQPDGSVSTYHQGDGAAPPAHPAPASSQCKTFQSAAIYGANATSTQAAVSNSTKTGTSGSAPPTNTAAAAAAPASLNLLNDIRGWFAILGAIMVSSLFGAFGPL